MNDYNNIPDNTPEKKNKGIFDFSKRVLLIILLGAAVLSFAFGYLLSAVISTPPQTGGNNTNNTTNVFADLYTFLDKNHHLDFDKDNALIYQLYAIVDSLNDPYTRIQAAQISVDNSTNPDNSEPETFEGIGITYAYENFEMVVSKVTRNSPAELAYIYPGDKVIGLVLDGADYIFSEKRLTSDQVVRLLKGQKGDEKTFIIKRQDDTVVNITLTYDRFATPTVTSKELNSNYGYIQITEFSTYTAEVFRTHLTSLESSVLNDSSKTLIIDLRNNPGGLLTSVVSVIKQLLVDDGEMVVAIRETKSGLSRSYTGGLEEKKPYNIKVLVNENSASAAEMLAAALHYTGGYEVFGTNTYGKNVFQETTLQFASKYGIALTYTKGYWFYKDFNKIDKNTNPIEVTQLLPEGYLKLNIPVFNKELHLDDVNANLVDVQKFLNVKYGLTLRVDGYFDLATENAIKQFQTEQGLVASGVYTLATAHKMYTDFIIHLENLSIDNQIVSLIS